MRSTLARKNLKTLSSSLRAAAAALLILLLSLAIPTTPASAAAGDLDPTFGRGGRVTTDFGGGEAAMAVAVQPDGKLVVAGIAWPGGGGPAQPAGDICVVRYKTDGSLDTSFGTNGRVLVDFNDSADSPSAVLVQPDGKIVVVGTTYSSTTAFSAFALVRLNPDGTFDSSFGTGGKVTTSFPSSQAAGASSVALQADGRLVVAGVKYITASFENYTSDFGVARYNADGTLDKTFGTDGLASVDFNQTDGAAGVAVQADGRVVLAGSAWNIQGNLGEPVGCAVARLNANGSPDNGFDGDGKTIVNFAGNDWCSALALQTDGRVVVAGAAMSGLDITGPDFGLARLNTDGSLDQTFGTGGKVMADFKSGSDMPYGVAVLPGGKIVAAGYVSGPEFDTTRAEFGAARFNADGSPDNTFGVGGRATTRFSSGAYAVARGMAAQPDGKVVVVGESGEQNSDIALARFDGGGATSNSFVRFSAANFGGTEGCAAASVTVLREGDLSTPASVEYRTRAGTARQSADYTEVAGTLLFAAGESSKTFAVPVNDDAYAEGAETIRVELVSASLNVNFRTPANAILTVADDDATDGTANPLDETQRFVCQHYHDFLSREPDAAGLQFWTQGIESCGSDVQCREVKRVDVSTAFFLSIEFQQTGYFVIRAHKAAFGNTKWTPGYQSFLRDTQRVGQGVVVGTPGADARLEANKQAFANAFVARAEFAAAHDRQTAEEYVDSLFLNAEVTPTAAERAAALAAYGAGGDAGRAAALRSVVETDSVYRGLYNAGFVLSQYFGYLRRNPFAAPDYSFDGYDFWLAKLDSFSLPDENVRDERVALARIRRAEMVKAFVTSVEYRQRFGQP
ncbi:MAG: DUF4214 domain-containing protein [Acidobacteria bacterium]|nr:DUF4214 domain-containing protein [Acidobacteriota bacterium]